MKRIITRLSCVLGICGISLFTCVGCVHHGNDMMYDTKEETSNFTYELPNNKLVINSDYSVLDISKGDSKDVEVTLYKKVRGDGEDDLNEKLNSMNCSYDNGSLNILSNKSEDFISSSEVTAHIKVPESLEVLETHNDVGDVSVKGQYDSLTTDLKVGRLRFDGTAKKCIVDSKTGDIELNLKQVEKDYNYNLNCDIGEINIKVPDGSDVNLVGTDKDDVNTSSGVKLNDDGMTLETKVRVGGIKIGNN